MTAKAHKGTQKCTNKITKQVPHEPKKGSEKGKDKSGAARVCMKGVEKDKTTGVEKDKSKDISKAGERKQDEATEKGKDKRHGRDSNAAARVSHGDVEDVAIKVKNEGKHWVPKLGMAQDEDLRC